MLIHPVSRVETMHTSVVMQCRSSLLSYGTDHLRSCFVFWMCSSAMLMGLQVYMPAAASRLAVPIQCKHIPSTSMIYAAADACRLPQHMATNHRRESTEGQPSNAGSCAPT
jgi:hypothetical protein